MDRVTIKVRTYSYQSSRHFEEVPAYLVVPGLAVHRALHEQGWHVTHIRSGHALAKDFRTLSEATEFAQAVSKMADWTKARSELNRPLLSKQVADARSRFRDQAGKEGQP
jgi:hypothetical protein